MKKPENQHQYTNSLINESSPYLEQHAHNPVDWYPWGDKALQKAKEEDKLLIISIGYSSCHWCHVMEEKSFEDEEVAEVMNEHYISIKVDREERPDIDQIYMDAAQMISGRGGWPLNAIALPDGRPIFAGTYFPKENWLQVLRYFVNLKNEDPQKVETQAQKITSGIQQLDMLPDIDSTIDYEIKTITDAIDNIEKRIDKQNGGVGSSPKFPMPSLWEFLLSYSEIQENDTVLNYVESTLTGMAEGGIYDHIGGGFSRYSTDSRWHVPHFEKMLYDNAQLIELYTHAWQASRDEKYKNIIYDCYDYMKNEFMSEEGGFYSAYDADSEGEEGTYYVWSSEEIDQHLGDGAPLFKARYGITNQGNWEEGKNVLYIKTSISELSQMFNKAEDSIRSELDAMKGKLHSIRNERPKPGLDDKQLTAWNAMAISAFAEAGRVFDESQFLKMAKKNAAFIESRMMHGDELMRSYKDGEVKISGFLDDYAFTINAFLRLYEATLEKKWLEKADKLAETTIEHFYNEENHMFYFVHNEKADLIARKTEYTDNVIPSSNAVMAHNLYDLGRLLDKENYRTISDQMLARMQANIEKNPIYYNHWAALYLKKTAPSYELAIVGENCIGKSRELGKYYLPNVLLLGSKKNENLPLLNQKYQEGKTMLYLCRNRTCKKPVENVNEVLEQLKNYE